MFQKSVWRLIIEHFEIPKLARKHVLLDSNRSHTNSSKPIRETHLDFCRWRHNLLMFLGPRENLHTRISETSNDLTCQDALHLRPSCKLLERIVRCDLKVVENDKANAPPTKLICLSNADAFKCCPRQATRSSVAGHFDNLL